jgi:hypothetical protein
LLSDVSWIHETLNINLVFGSGKWDRTTDLRLMSPAL